MGDFDKKAFFLKHHLVMFLAVAFIFGLTLPQPGKWLSEPKVGPHKAVSSILIFLIFLISGMKLKTNDVMTTLRTPLPLVMAFTSILFITPAMGFLPTLIPGVEKSVVKGDLGYYYRMDPNATLPNATLPNATLPSRTTLTYTVTDPVGEPVEADGIPKEILIGFAIFCCVPTTLTSGAQLVTQGAKRASVLALMITSGTNLIGTGTVPFALKLVLSDVDVSLKAVNLLIKLLIVILAPTIVGKALSQFVPAVADFCKKWGKTLGVVSSTLLVCTVWMSISRSQNKIVNQPPLRLLAVVGGGIGLHLAFWVVHGWILWFPAIKDLHHRRCVFLLASQKTLPVSLAVITALSDGVPEDEQSLDSGLIMLPCILGHLSQLVIDSFLVAHWMTADKKKVEMTSPGGAEMAEASQPLTGNTHQTFPYTDVDLGGPEEGKQYFYEEPTYAEPGIGDGYYLL